MAVLIDATLVRLVLVPAGMALLGNMNWYLPKWLQWLPELHLEGVAVPAVARIAPGRVRSAVPRRGYPRAHGDLAGC